MRILVALIGLILFLLETGSARAGVVSGTEIEATAVSYVKEQLPPGIKNLVVAVEKHIKDVVLKEEGIRCAVVSEPSLLLAGRFSLSVKVLLGEKVVKVIPVTLKVDGEIDVVTAKNRIVKNKKISAEDLEIRTKRLKDVRKNAVLREEACLEKVALRDIDAGTIIMSSMLSMPVVVHAGRSVEIVVIKGGVEVRAKGTAMQNGRLGKFIKVRNGRTGKIITAKVIGEGIVEMKI